jgi:hypothetical protein
VGDAEALEILAKIERQLMREAKEEASKPTREYADRPLRAIDLIKQKSPWY